ncbi:MULTISPECIES: STAS domain-containing protein [Streptacidiphilus]|uniref:Anti-sigma factor antagonist n=2 Tax=Streptacidiphilus TaxID=228398 RepID=A0ABV6UVR0_9ACTN|nr:STAS domain-containing protein [Streptacidiphilus jeojiense]
MTPELTINAGHNATGPVLALVGDLDHATAPQLRTAVTDTALTPGQILTLDLSAVAFCDSSGITALIAAHRRALAQEADLVLADVPARVLRILRILGLDQVLRLAGQ